MAEGQAGGASAAVKTAELATEVKLAEVRAQAKEVAEVAKGEVAVVGVVVMMAQETGA